MIENIKIFPEIWSEDHYKFHYDYVSPEGYLWNVDHISDNMVHLWTINAWGVIYTKAVNTYEFKQTWKEHK